MVATSAITASPNNASALQAEVASLDKQLAQEVENKKIGIDKEKVEAHMKRMLAKFQDNTSTHASTSTPRAKFIKLVISAPQLWPTPLRKVFTFTQDFWYPKDTSNTGNEGKTEES